MQTSRLQVVNKCRYFFGCYHGFELEGAGLFPHVVGNSLKVKMSLLPLIH